MTTRPRPLSRQACDVSGRQQLPIKQYPYRYVWSDSRRYHGKRDDITGTLIWWHHNTAPLTSSCFIQFPLQQCLLLSYPSVFSSTSGSSSLLRHLLPPPLLLLLFFCPRFQTLSTGFLLNNSAQLSLSLLSRVFSSLPSLSSISWVIFFLWGGGGWSFLPRLTRDAPPPPPPSVLSFPSSSLCLFLPSFPCIDLPGSLYPALFQRLSKPQLFSYTR